ncbi:KpsF/GutQ family sugar-phosphate isomerase [uncultured Desulfobulbus sp.]|uniref:KpsF/GutQ family sugar-phosphate isomerase n=1 Tax=uncultured Desulfobulbus sp. TaxID=239745 RepID=UPI0029C760CF|nr:KpsF/GutQ family sugar-phosphate isomerase [uncultured Desulfobulbus sp.]
MSIALAKEVLLIESEGILAVRDNLGEEFEKALDIIMACPSRLVVTGIGKSGLVGQKISATLNSTGTASVFLHPVEAMHGDLGMVASTDVVLAISYSGETAELNRLLSSLKERQVPIIALCGQVESNLAHHAVVTLNVAVPREACPLGLAPTSSTTATLAMGDALAVALLNRKQFRAEDFRRNHPGGSLGERLKVAVREVMLTGEKVPVISSDAPFLAGVVELNKKNLGAVFIKDGKGKLLGIITDGDIRRMLSSGKNIQEIDLDAGMKRNPVAISSALMAADALSIMQQHEITVLAVVDEVGRLEGILHLHDLLGKGEFRFMI